MDNKYIAINSEETKLLDSPKEINSIADLFRINKYTNILFCNDQWELTNFGDTLTYTKNSSVRSYFVIRRTFAREYHMHNGIIYKVIYNPKSKSIIFGALGGDEVQCDDLKFS